jgi:hypothetical protein
LSRSRGGVLLLAVAGLLALDITLLLGMQETREEMGTANPPFQVAVGGLGLGSSVSPAWSFFALDPRTSATCENELFPLPGLPCPNPSHGAALADLPPLRPRK